MADSVAHEKAVDEAADSAAHHKVTDKTGQSTRRWRIAWHKKTVHVAYSMVHCPDKIGSVAFG